MAHGKMVKTISGILALSTTMSVLMANLSLTAYASSSVTIDWNNEKQVIDGFGASQACDVYADQIYNFAKRDEVMDLLLMTGGSVFQSSGARWAAG